MNVIQTDLNLRTDRQSINAQGDTLESTNQFSVEIVQVGAEGCYFRLGQERGVSVSGKLNISDLAKTMEAFCSANPEVGKAIAFSMLGTIGRDSLDRIANREVSKKDVG